MDVLTRHAAETYLREAEKMNPGSWVKHSLNVAKAAAAIARAHPRLDPEIAYILGCLHDIGRREGKTDMRHSIDGFRFLSMEGHFQAARICITHSFPLKNVNAGSGEWDCTRKEKTFVRDYLARIRYTPYDRLIQLCDAVTMGSGYCLMEKRLVDVALRRKVYPLTVDKWKAFLKIKDEFEGEIGDSIYRFLPGVVENTFGCPVEMVS